MPEQEPLQQPGLSQPAISGESTPRSAENLQFQTAEFHATDATPRCVLCRGALGDSYYHLDGSTICKVCASQKRANMEPVRGAVLWKSILYGLGAALAGSALYGIVLAATGAQFALLSILVGIMVGKAMSLGSGGRGGRKLQILAVLLTYGAITTGYTPAILKGVAQAYAKKQSSTPSQKINQEQVRGGRAVLALIVFLAFVIGLAMAAPFLMIAHGFSAILNILIIFFGLQQAWRRTRGEHGILIGPRPVADLTPPAATA